MVGRVQFALSVCLSVYVSLSLSLSLCLTKEVSAYFTQATELTNDDAETAVKVFNSAVKLAGDYEKDRYKR